MSNPDLQSETAAAPAPEVLATMWVLVKRKPGLDVAFGMGRTPKEAYASTGELFGGTAAPYSTSMIKGLGFKAVRVKLVAA